MNTLARLTLLGALLVFAMSTPAPAMPPPPAMMILEPRSSLELSSWDRGQLRMFLQQNALACTLGRKGVRPLGEVRLVLDVAEKNSPRVKATGRTAEARLMASCLGRLLRQVRFPSPAPAWHWEGTLRFGGAYMEANVRDSAGPLESLSGGQLALENAVLAALEQPATCMDKYFASEEVVSMVLLATLDTGEDLKLVASDVRESTTVPEELVQCVRAQLATLSIPVERAVSAEVRIALLRPTHATPDENLLLIQGTP